MSGPAQPGARAGEVVGECPRCGGALIDGRVSLAGVATLRFVLKIGTTEVGTEVRARLCEECGHVEFVATDPAAIKRARQAKALGQAPRPSLFPSRAVRRRTP